MRRWLIPLLAVLNVALLLLLMSRWMTPDGQMRTVRWQPPGALPVQFEGWAPLPDVGVDLSRYVATLERPLFVASRRPPPPPAPPKPVETLPAVRVLAVYGAMAPAGGASSPAGGIIARVDGVVRRLRVGEHIGGWQIEQVSRSEVVLSQGADRQTVALRRGQVDDAADSARPGVSTGAAGVGGAAAASNQKPVEAWRRDAIMQVREMNARRARSGLPPLPEP